MKTRSRTTHHISCCHTFMCEQAHYSQNALLHLTLSPLRWLSSRLFPATINNHQHAGKQQVQRMDPDPDLDPDQDPAETVTVMLQRDNADTEQLMQAEGCCHVHTAFSSSERPPSTPLKCLMCLHRSRTSRTSINTETRRRT